MLRTLKTQGEDVKPENFSKIFDEKSIAYMIKVLELENQFNDYAKLRGTDPSRIGSSVMNHSSFLDNSLFREKDPERKIIESKISSMVKSVIVKDIEDRNPSRSGTFAKGKHRSETSGGPLSRSSKSYEDYDGTRSDHGEDFLDEQRIGFKIEKVENEIEMHGSEYNEFYEGSSITRRLFDITSMLAEMQKSEIERLISIANNKQISVSLVNDLLVIFSSLFGKNIARVELERWLNKKVAELFKVVSGERAERRKEGIESEVDDMKRIFREFFVKLD